jgi:hypothetical protein
LAFFEKSHPPCISKHTNANTLATVLIPLLCIYIAPSFCSINSLANPFYVSPCSLVIKGATLAMPFWDKKKSKSSQALGTGTGRGYSSGTGSSFGVDDAMAAFPGDPAGGSFYAPPETNAGSIGAGAGVGGRLKVCLALLYLSGERMGCACGSSGDGGGAQSDDLDNLPFSFDVS